MATKVAFLGYGVAGMIFDAIASNYAPDLEVTFVTLDSNSTFDFGLRYIHPTNEPVDDSDPWKSIYNFAAYAMGANFFVNTTVELNWAIRTPLGWLPVNSFAGHKISREALVRDYCRTNFRSLNQYAMNSFVENPKPRRIGASYNDVFDYIKRAGRSQIYKGLITDIDLDAKQVKFNTKLKYCFLDYDIIINSMPLPTFYDILNEGNGIVFNSNPALFYRSYSSVPLKLNYAYNIAGDHPNSELFNLSRVTLKEHSTDFEFSINRNKLKTTPEIRELSPYFEEETLKILKELDVFETVNWSTRNAVFVGMNPHAHFKTTDATDQLIADYSDEGVYMLGRYAQWDHGIKVEDIWRRAYNIIEEIK